MSGSATATPWLLSEGLLDRLNLLVHPLTLLSSDTFGSGVVRLIYAPAEAPAAS